MHISIDCKCCSYDQEAPVTRPERSFIHVGNFLPSVEGEYSLQSPPVRTMPSNPGTEKVNQYKLDSVFYGETVFHTKYLLAGQPIIGPRTAWRREKKLGAGASGVVWREKEFQSGQLRAVKVISKQHLIVRELEALVELQDVSLHLFTVGETNRWLASKAFRPVFRLV